MMANESDNTVTTVFFDELQSMAVVFNLGYSQGYEKTSYGVCKIKKIYCFVIKTEKTGPDFGLATGDLDVRANDLGAPNLETILKTNYIWRYKNKKEFNTTGVGQVMKSNGNERALYRPTYAFFPVSSPEGTSLQAVVTSCNRQEIYVSC
jgi:hypothetical protein